MNKEVISIVVPIYKVEKYIKKCIDSIIKQTYKNLEIILVDDGSPDECGKICDEYAQKDKRIKVIHKENGGLSDARNMGIDISTGKYICFVDSDDYIDDKYIELLYDAIRENNVEIAQCGIKKITEDEVLIEDIGYKENNLKNGKQMLKDLYITNWENIIVWNKMYLAKLFDDIRFPKGKIHEDEYTTYKILYKANKIAILKDCLYNYRQNIESITGKKFNIKRLDGLEALNKRLDFFKNNKERELYELTLKNYLVMLRKYYINVKKNIKSSHDIQKKLKKEYKEKTKTFFIVHNCSILEKLKVKFFIVAPNIYWIKFTIEQWTNNYKIRRKCNYGKKIS